MPYDPETGEYYEAENASGGEQQRSNQDWAKLRQQEKATREAQRERDEAKREAAFLRAGIDVEDPKTKYFVKGYDGELTRDAIRAAAIEAGYSEAPQAGAGAEGQQTADQAAAAAAEAQRLAELGAQQRVDGASAGATPPPIDPSNLITEAFQKGGEGALLDSLAAQGIPIAYEGIVQQ
jgi:hypothetical protein